MKTAKRKQRQRARYVGAKAKDGHGVQEYDRSSALTEAHGHARDGEWYYRAQRTLYTKLLTDQYVPHAKTKEITTKDDCAQGRTNGETRECAAYEAAYGITDRSRASSALVRIRFLPESM